jgi:hypothetical protein
MGAVGVDATGWHLCHVLLDTGDDSAWVSRQGASVGVRQDHQRTVERDVYLARPPAAALAEALLYYGDPNVPT